MNWPLLSYHRYICMGIYRLSEICGLQSRKRCIGECIIIEFPVRVIGSVHQCHLGRKSVLLNCKISCLSNITLPEVCDTRIWKILKEMGAYSLIAFLTSALQIKHWSGSNFPHFNPSGFPLIHVCSPVSSPPDAVTMLHVIPLSPNTSTV